MERLAFVTCDGCLPPHSMMGNTVAEMRAVGWEFDDLERGPHLCPWCAHISGHRRPRRRTPPHETPALPNTLIIGASKCGTTALHRYLAAHPEIHMAEAKEMRFFHDPACLDRLDTYATFFDGNAPVRGEASPVYSFHPLAPGVPERVRAVIPDVKLIYIVRDPLERTVSHFVERRAQRWYLDAFHEALGDLADPHNVYVAPSRYATQLERYLRLFPKDQLLVVDRAELLSNRRETMRGVFRFLGVDEDFWSPRYEEVHNVGESKTRWTRTGGRLARSRLADTLRWLLPPRPRKALVAPVKRVVRTKLEPPVLEDALGERLRDVYEDEVGRLRELTGKRFASWQL
jgi:hypothetical protein